MRLYRDIKILLFLNINIKVTGKCEETMKVKKYAGKVDLYCSEHEDYHYLSTIHNTLKKLKFDDYFLNDNSINIIDDKVRNEVDLDSKIENQESEVKILDRLHATKQHILTSIYQYRLSLEVYGKLLFGVGSNLEECFETNSGLHITEIILPKSLHNYIYNKLSTALNDPDVSIEFDYQFDDDAKLLPIEEEFKDALYENDNEIWSLIEDAVDDKIHNALWQNPDDE